ncbi:D-2-hydroxyacid dehydrogenase family protein [Amycolatopsis sp. PS_44_ISF1]|uniref:D-2-hydroxyacid dehydrogenase family protein n=1 Tax=Amycolatopsis sp. PS_44_ISF1 TaxID=2974917 RepID=UPI0028DD7CEC|nr:D-2-hydroxyacid dehydrogenase family protein [Amycolatopsis sp. PS_44_ISF1]MDT8914025.1 D-2-hydroxyacid dehydrogenase family protein [Amycolatopsis sp. PS_44_ISF1]
MKIAILDDYQNVALTFGDWNSLAAEIEVFTEAFSGPEEVVRRLAGFDAVVAMRERTRFPAEVFDRLPRLKLLVSTGPRNAAIDLEAAARHGVVVSATGYLGPPAAELTWALILAAARNLPAEFRSVREGGWQVGVGTMLHGKTLGVLGLGRLGAETARIGRAFGMEPIAWSPNLTAGKAAEHGATAVTKDELFARSDVLSIHLVLSDRSRGLVGARELALMKPDSILVNTSRGPIVEEADLVDALRRKVIGCAALDVHDIEPLPSDHPLRTLDNAVLTPHIGYVSRETYEIFYRDAVEDIAAFQAGSPVRVLS